jgi:integrase
MTLKLTNTAIDAAIERGHFLVNGKPKKLLGLGDNLYAEITRKTGKLTWPYRFKRVATGKWSKTSCGEYPVVGLSLAREIAFDIAKGLARGIDPISEREKKTADAKKQKTLADVLVEWFNVMRRDADISESSKIEDLRHIDQLIGRDATEKKPALKGLFSRKKLIAEITTADIAAKLDKIASGDDGRKATAKALRGTIRAVFKFAIGRGYATINPAAIDLFDLPKADTENHVALIEPQEVGELMRDIRGHSDDIRLLTSAALEMLARCAARPGNVAGMQWEWVKGDRIVIPVRFMKIKKDRRTGKPRGDHRMPITKQMQTILDLVQPLTGHGKYVFSQNNKPMGEKTLQRALRALGYAGRHVPHGFRTTFDTLMTDEEWSAMLIDMQLAHGDEAATIKAYRRVHEMEKAKQQRGDKASDRLWERRVEMMQSWSDLLDQLSGANVVTLEKKAA